jgi:hypothetical protein
MLQLFQLTPQVLDSNNSRGHHMISFFQFLPLINGVLYGYRIKRPWHSPYGDCRNFLGRSMGENNIMNKLLNIQGAL